MIPVLLRAGGRYHLRHRWQLALAILGVALGVAVAVAVDIATASARRAFDLSTEAVSGRATHEITGGPAGIADSTYVRLRMGPAATADLPIAPVIDRYVRLPDHGGRVLRLLGLDPFAEAPFRNFVYAAAPPGSTVETAPPGSETGGAADSSRSANTRPTPAGSAALDIGVLLTGRAVVLSGSTAAALGVLVGDSVRLAFGTSSAAALVAGVLDLQDEAARLALVDVVIADISTAQELTGSTGTLDRIDVRVSSEAATAALRAALPAGLRLMPTDARAGATTRLTRAFDTNLTALALVALVFGMFLIYNSVSFSVIQRRPLLGLLRAQGATAHELFVQILVEAAVLGAVATLLGIAGGSALGSLLVRLVSRTINDLYFAVTVSSLHIEPLTFAKATLLGLGATVAAAVPPAVEALRTPPRATLARALLERRALRSAPALALAGMSAAALAALLLVVPLRSITLGFASLFVLVLAGALVTPAATILLMRAIHPLTARLGAVGRMAAGGVAASLSRTAPAVAALAVALAVGIAVTLMILSFRNAVVRWLEQSLQADVYIAAPGVGGDGSANALDPRLPAAVLGVPGVAGVSTYRQLLLLVPGPESGDSPDLVRLFAFDPFHQHRTGFEMLDIGFDAAWRAFDHGAVLISEPLAYRRALGVGDSIVLPTDRGSASFAVAGVYRDYASEHGVIFMPRATYDAWWRDRSVTSLAVFAQPGEDPDAVLARIRELPSAGGALGRPNRGLREATLQVFDRTFLITGVLRLLALIVAFVGVTGALMAFQLERARDMGVLRALGLTSLQIWSLITSQTALMGLAAAVLAMPLGIAMSWTMVHVINRRSFGWSFDLVFAAAPFMQAFAIGIAAAVLAGVYPALRVARMRPAQVLRDE